MVWFSKVCRAFVKHRKLVPATRARNFSHDPIRFLGEHSGNWHYEGEGGGVGTDRRRLSAGAVVGNELRIQLNHIPPLNSKVDADLVLFVCFES